MAAAFSGFPQLDAQRKSLDKARELKAEGNTAYKAKKIGKAIGKYHRALIMLRGVGDTTSMLNGIFGALMSAKCDTTPKDLIEPRDQLVSECYNNLAACLLTRPDPNYQRVAEYCSHVLRFDSKNEKGSYRLGTALFHLGEYDEAKMVFENVPSLKHDRKVREMMKTIVKKEKEDDIRLRDMYMGMFSSSGTSPATQLADRVQIKIRCDGPDSSLGLGMFSSDISSDSDGPESSGAVRPDISSDSDGPESIGAVRPLEGPELSGAFTSDSSSVSESEKEAGR